MSLGDALLPITNGLPIVRKSSGLLSVTGLLLCDALFWYPMGTNHVVYNQACDLYPDIPSPPFMSSIPIKLGSVPICMKILKYSSYIIRVRMLTSIN